MNVCSFLLLLSLYRSLTLERCDRGLHRERSRLLMGLWVCLFSLATGERGANEHNGRCGNDSWSNVNLCWPNTKSPD